MPDIEERLRTALDALADEVPPSENATAELRSRLYARHQARGRVPVLTAAAAALVVLVIFVGAVVLPIMSRENVPTGQAHPGAPRTSVPRPELGTVIRGGETLTAVGYLDGRQYCTVLLLRGERAGRLACEPVPARWPGGPANSLVETRELLNGDPADDAGMLAQRLVFLTDPRVATLTARRGNGTAVRVTELDRNASAALFLADFAGPTEGFGYTARDSAGRVLEDAIT
jgi:hypothetical protein